MAFVTSIAIRLEGHLLVGSLKFQYLELVKLKEMKSWDEKIATALVTET
jgi:hypothetical protein